MSITAFYHRVYQWSVRGMLLLIMVSVLAPAVTSAQQTAPATEGVIVNKIEDLVGVWESQHGASGAKAYRQYEADGTIREAYSLDNLQTSPLHIGRVWFENNVYYQKNDHPLAPDAPGKYEVRIHKAAGAPDRLSFRLIEDVDGYRVKDFAAGMTRVEPALQATGELETNKEIARRYMEEIWNNGDMAVADELIAEDFVNHNPFGPLPPDREGLKIAAAGSAAAPGNYAIDDIIAEGDKVAIRTPFHGDLNFEAIVILRIKDGKITDRWGYHDRDYQLAEANKAVARRWIEEIWNNGNLSVIDEIVAEDYIDHDPAAPGAPTDREGVKSGVTEFRRAFPDAHFAVDAMMAEGDRVVVPLTFTGTHQGEIHGAPATGKQVTWKGIFIYRIQNGKIAERWGQLDTLSFMIQLGAVPPPGEGKK